jgi:hypothetical protein
MPAPQLCVRHQGTVISAYVYRKTGKESGVLYETTAPVIKVNKDVQFYE